MVLEAADMKWVFQALLFWTALLGAAGIFVLAVSWLRAVAELQ